MQRNSLSIRNSQILNVFRVNPPVILALRPIIGHSAPHYNIGLISGFTPWDVRSTVGVADLALQAGCSLPPLLAIRVIIPVEFNSVSNRVQLGIESINYLLTYYGARTRTTYITYNACLCACLCVCGMCVCVSVVCVCVPAVLCVSTCAHVCL